MSRRGVSATLAGLVCALAVAACGGSDEGEAPAAQQGPGFGSAQALQSVTCTDWKQADPQVRAGILRRLRNITAGQVTGDGVAGRGTVLEDERAHNLFNSYCSQAFARGFTLYKLYGQAAGFAGVAP